MLSHALLIWLLTGPIMSATSLPVFLPGVPVDKVLGRLAKAGGNEVESGKLASPESSAALAVNTFGWFAHLPHLLPSFPGLDAGWPPIAVEVEYCARFPWSGGRHPWLDAFVETPACIIGVEFQAVGALPRQEDGLSVSRLRPAGLGQRHAAIRAGEGSAAHWRRFVRASRCGPACEACFRANHRVRAARESPPFSTTSLPNQSSWVAATSTTNVIMKHRAEVQLFSTMVAGAAVKFASCSYREWLATWQAANTEVQRHAQAVMETFRP